MNTKPATPSPLVEGQMVIIIARFILIVASLILIMVDARSTKAVSPMVTRVEIMTVLLLAVSNFYLVSQVLTKRKTHDIVLYGVSLADLLVITLAVMMQGGFASGTYIFYFPAMLMFALAFPALELYLFLGGTICIYAMISMVSMSFMENTAPVTDGLETLFIRLLMLAAIAVCGNYFAQIERNRRNVILSNHFAAQQQQQLQPTPTAVAMPQQVPARQNG